MSVIIATQPTALAISETIFECAIEIEFGKVSRVSGVRSLQFSFVLDGATHPRAPARLTNRLRDVAWDNFRHQFIRIASANRLALITVGTAYAGPSIRRS